MNQWKVVKRQNEWRVYDNDGWWHETHPTLRQAHTAATQLARHRHLLQTRRPHRTVRVALLTMTDLKTIAEAIHASDYNRRYHRIDMWAAYQYAAAVAAKLETVEDWHGKTTNE